MILRPPKSKRTTTLFPYTTLFRSAVRNAIAKGGENWLGELSAETRNYVGKFRKQIGAGSEARRWDKESVYTNIERAGQEQGWSFERIERAKDYADRQISRDEQLLVRREKEARSEERRVGKECVSTGRSRW